MNTFKFYKQSCMSTVLTIQNIKKNYGPIQALKGIELNVPKSSVYGILGPNGSGKTTLLGILLDVLKADQGEYQWNEFNTAQQARQQIGSLLETPNFYHYMTAEDNLNIAAQIKQRGFDDVDRVLKQVNLYERRHSKFSTFSLGMKQRLAIASALLGKPSILVLDEPTNGLDPVGIAEIRELIIQLSHEGMTIIIASHMLDEIEKVCTHVAILKLGNLIIEGSVGEVLNDEDTIEINASNREKLIDVLKKFDGIKSMKLEKNIQLTLHPNRNIEQLNQYCFEHGIILNHIIQRKRSLESKFMEITQ
jgi:ABC-type multidrug transport system ATPase subunit